MMDIIVKALARLFGRRAVDMLAEGIAECITDGAMCVTECMMNDIADAIE